MKTQIPEPGPAFVAVDDEGIVRDTSVLESSGMAYDPGNMTMDLTKAEKLRTTALMLAINAYDKIIIKDAEYLKEMHNESRREGGPVIRPATMNAMVEAAINFEAFLIGRYSRQAQIPEPVQEPSGERPENAEAQS